MPAVFIIPAVPIIPPSQRFTVTSASKGFWHEYGPKQVGVTLGIVMGGFIILVVIIECLVRQYAKKEHERIDRIVEEQHRRIMNPRSVGERGAL
jgi:hypothetical protein